MKDSLLCLALISIRFVAIGQDSTAITAKQSIYVELGGTGGSITLNYDRIIRKTQSWKYGLRTGIGTNSFSLFRASLLGEVYALKGKRGKYLELGFGVSYLFPINSEYTSNNILITSKVGDYLWFVPRIGYRYQHPTRGNIFRVGLTPPLVLQSGALSVRPMVGISFGQTF